MKIGLLGLSNPCSSIKVEQTKEKLMKHNVVVSPYLSMEATPQQRASVWNAWMKQKDFDYIFDISGGDLANECIPYLDFNLYKDIKTVYVGYSDCTVILNSLYKVAQKPCLLFQIRDSIYDFFEEDVYSIQWNHREGNVQGIVVGGNIRCLLKLAGTPYFPDCTDKILFLESMSGNAYRIRTYFAQLKMMPEVMNVKAIVLGQFSELDKDGLDDCLYDCLKEWHVPVFRTKDIGHSHDSKALWIGKEIHVC